MTRSMLAVTLTVLRLGHHASAEAGVRESETVTLKLPAVFLSQGHSGLMETKPTYVVELVEEVRADLIDDVRVTGTVLIDGQNIYKPGVDLLDLRKKVGMVFQRPNPFPLSVFDNVVYGPRVHGLRDPKDLEARLIRSLEAVHLWDELKDRLDENALGLSGEQQQRLCIARLIAVEPEILLMDEPCSALDLAATANIEDLMAELKKRYTIVIVTHNMQQAARVSDVTGYFLLGELVEIGETRRIFTAPKDSRTEDYITGRFG